MADVIEWIRANEGRFAVDAVAKDSPLGGLGVYAKRFIKEDTVLLKLPKENILSPKTCGISNLLEEEELQDMEKLVIAYIFESRQSKSPWGVFIASIKAAPAPDPPNLWPLKYRQLLARTDVERIGGLETEEMKDFCRNASSFSRRHHGILGELDLDQYAEALIKVSSRAFLVDEFHNLSLVPGACLFNHSDQENVHFETDFEVCGKCGKMYCGCIDDEDSQEDEEFGAEEGPEDDGERVDSGELEKQQNVCEIRTVNDITAGAEIMNTYGEEPNAMLLCRYGFVIWHNLHETVNVSRQVLSYCKQHNLKDRYRWWRANLSSFFEDLDMSTYSLMEVNSEGDITEPLRVLLAILSLSDKNFRYIIRQRKLNLEKLGRPEPILREVLHARLRAFADGKLTSEGYLRLASEQKGRLKTILLFLGTSRWCIERAISKLA